VLNRHERLRFNGGGGNGERQLGLGSNQHGEASIYRGIRSTCSQGRLRSNLSLNRLEIAILEINFDRGSNEELNSVMIRLGRSDRGV
jgi:hypothetical protein